MQRHHINKQPLAILAVIRNPTNEVEWPRPIKPDDTLPVVEGSDWLACVAVVVFILVHHKN